MGFETLKTLQIQMVAYVFQLIFVLLATIGSTYLHNTRTLWIVFNMTFSIAGAAMVGQLDGKWSRFFGYCLTMGYTPNFPIILSMLSANIAGFTKKMTVNAMVSIPNALSNAWRYLTMYSCSSRIALATSLDHSSFLSASTLRIRLDFWQ